MRGLFGGRQEGKDGKRLPVGEHEAAVPGAQRRAVQVERGSVHRVSACLRTGRARGMEHATARFRPAGILRRARQGEALERGGGGGGDVAPGIRRLRRHAAAVAEGAVRRVVGVLVGEDLPGEPVEARGVFLGAGEEGGDLAAEGFRGRGHVAFSRLIRSSPRRRRRYLPSSLATASLITGMTPVLGWGESRRRDTMRPRTSRV